MTKQSWALQMCSNRAAEVVLATGRDEGSDMLGWDQQDPNGQPGLGKRL